MAAKPIALPSPDHGDVADRPTKPGRGDEAATLLASTIVQTPESISVPDHELTR